MSKNQIIAKWKYILAGSLLCLLSYYTYGQGCSDAGFCTINSFKPNGGEPIKNQFKIGAFVGKGDNAISVYGNYVEYNRQLSKNFGLDAKLTTLAQSGNGISTFGISDFFLNSNYQASDKVKFTLGAKIPLSNANKTSSQVPLPMDYQASLGTFDVIFGIGYDLKKIQLVAAIQQPVSQNENQFISTNFPANSMLRSFQTTNKYQRSGDVLLRISYPIQVSSKLKFTASALPIYHLANDKYSDELNVVKEIKGSKGLTLNGNVYFDYEVNSKNFLQLNLGAPFIVRDARPDGLTRSFIANIEYRIKF